MAAAAVRSFRKGIYKLVLTFMVCFFSLSRRFNGKSILQTEEVIQTILTSSFSLALPSTTTVAAQCFMLERAFMAIQIKFNDR